MLHDWRMTLLQNPRILVDYSHTQATRVATHPPETPFSPSEQAKIHPKNHRRLQRHRYRDTTSHHNWGNSTRPNAGPERNPWKWENSRQLRVDENTERISLDRSLDRLFKAKVLKNIQKEEQRADTYRMFNNIRGKSNKSRLSTVDVPEVWLGSQDLEDPDIHLADSKLWDTEDKPHKSITLPEEVELYLMARNRRHIGQAHGTPFTVTPLAKLLTWDGDTDTAELILKGEYNADELDNITQLLLKHCETVSTLDAVQPELSVDEFVGKNQSLAWENKHLPFCWNTILCPSELCYSFTVAQVTVKGSTRSCFTCYV
jgi:hypothetical protein